MINDKMDKVDNDKKIIYPIKAKSLFPVSVCFQLAETA